MTLTAINTEELKIWAGLIYDLCWVHLDETKGYLLESRLSDLMKETNSRTFSELYYKVKTKPSTVLLRKVINVMTTGETSFYRDTAPFICLQQKVLPEIIDRRKRTTPSGLPVSIRVWSAGSSTGQEAYSIAIAVREMVGGDPSMVNVQVLGTDISEAALSKAGAGIFTRLEVERGLPPEKLKKWFMPMGDGYRIADEIRAMVAFRHLNLREPLDFSGKFDVIFCRNVAIYFTEKDKRNLFDRISRILAPDGFLFIGSTETLSGVSSVLTPHRHLRTVFYQLKK